MSDTHQIIGNTICAWNEDSPLIWTMSEEMGKDSEHYVAQFRLDLVKLIDGYDRQFLLTLKDLLMERRKKVALRTVITEYKHLCPMLLKMRDAGLLNSSVTRIDAAFLLGLRTIVGEVTIRSLQTLKRLFTTYRGSTLFAPDILPGDFPTKQDVDGRMGKIQSSILTQALSRAACVEVLRVADDAYEVGKIDIGLYSFLHLCFHVYARPYSYRRLVLSDLQIDVHPQTGVRNYFLWIVPAKTRVKAPTKYSVSLHRTVGELLEMQRIHVINTYGHLVDKEDMGRLALFPARHLRKDGNWISAHARSNFGATSDDDGGLHAAYLKSIMKLMDSIRFNFNGLRHTVGTQLAEAGCSAATIKAVLKHAHDRTCRAYVDICFHGLAANLSNSMRSGFDRHYPVHAFRSKHDPVHPAKAIRSEDLETGRIDLTGECGREVACQYAPIACYACNRFVPCFDADHTINLDIVDREIEQCKKRGLAFKAMLERSKDARRYIMLVTAATEQRRCAEADRLST